LELAVLIGLQASGKSTFVAAHLAATHVVVSKDLMRSAKHKERRQQLQIAAALAAGRSVAVDNTNPGPAQWAPLIATAREHGARVVAYYFPPDPAGSRARNAERPAATRVPEVGIASVLAQLREPPTRAHGFDAVRTVAFDGSGGFTVTDRDPAGTVEDGGNGGP
jgi:predicted kinase